MMKEYKSQSTRLHSAIDELRSENVPEGARGKAFDVLTSEKPNRRRISTFATGTALLVGITVLLWPGRRAMAWQQVVQTTLGTHRLHQVNYMRAPGGVGFRRIGEQWIDGKKDAMMANYEAGKDGPKIVLDVRFDGRRSYRLNWNGFGEVYDSPYRRSRAVMSGRFNMESLLADQRIKVEKGPEEVQLDGMDVLRYQARAYEGPVVLGYSSRLNFYAEKDSGRLLRTEYLDRKGQISEYSTVEYPVNISPETFMPPTTGPRVIDLDRDGAILKAAMAKGEPLGHGNVLRAAIQSPTGELMVLWTGAPPNGDGSQRPFVVGHADHGLYAPDQLTASRWKMTPRARYLFNGLPLSGLALQLNKPVYGTVTLRMPILVEDLKYPIRDGRGIIRGYHSKQVGTKTIKNFPVIDTIPFSVLEAMKGNHQT